MQLALAAFMSYRSGSCLKRRSAHEVASSGGETEFASTYAAFDDLDEAEKARYLEMLMEKAKTAGLSSPR